MKNKQLSGAHFQIEFNRMAKTEEKEKESRETAITRDIIILSALIKYYNSPSANNSWTVVVTDWARFASSSHAKCHQISVRRQRQIIAHNIYDKRDEQ